MILNSSHNLLSISNKNKYIFLAGSMDNTSDNWRMKLIDTLESNFSFFDPTNLCHDSLGNQEMKTHINWELNALERADIILLNFLPDSLSPISLVELGMYMLSAKLIVVCPDAFYKSNYVHTLCEKYNTPIFKEIDSSLKYILKYCN